MNKNIELRHSVRDDCNSIAELIHLSTSRWYEANDRAPVFQRGISFVLLFFEIYEALDPGKCLLAIDRKTREIVESCFYHPRETHVSLRYHEFASGSCRKGKTMIWLIPSDRPAITKAMYDLGARNCELYFAQTTGVFPEIRDIVMPTFMPETA